MVKGTDSSGFRESLRHRGKIAGVPRTHNGPNEKTSVGGMRVGGGRFRKKGLKT